MRELGNSRSLENCSLCFFSDIVRFFAQCPKYLEPFRTKSPKKFCLLLNIYTLVAASCSFTLKFCEFLFATKPLPLQRLMSFLQHAHLLQPFRLSARRSEVVFAFYHIWKLCPNVWNDCGYCTIAHRLRDLDSLEQWRRAIGARAPKIFCDLIFFLI